MSIFDPPAAGDRNPQEQGHRWMWAPAAGLLACVVAWQLVGGSPAVRFVIAAVVVGLLSFVMTHGIKQATPEDEIDTSEAPAVLVASADRLMTSEVTEAGWLSARSRHDRLMLEWMPYETDPLLALRYPVLSDVREEPTAAMFEAMHEANALRTERFPGQRLARDYVGAVRRLASAWENARRHAMRKVTSGLGDADRRTLDQIVKLLRHSADAATPHERATYASRAYLMLKELVDTGVIVVPMPAMGAIETARRGAIEARSTES